MSSAAGSKSCDLGLNQVTNLHFYYSWMWDKSYRKCVAEPESFTSGLGSSRSRGEKAEISGDRVVELQPYDLGFKGSQWAVCWRKPFTGASKLAVNGPVEEAEERKGYIPILYYYRCKRSNGVLLSHCKGGHDLVGRYWERFYLACWKENAYFSWAGENMGGSHLYLGQHGGRWKPEEVTGRHCF